MSYKFWHPFFSVQYSEYAGGSHLSTSGDVYSFGVVLMEILTGKRPTDPLFCNGFSIINFCKTSFPGQILDIVDAHLLEECNGFIQSKAQAENDVCRCLLSLVQVALSCTRPFPRERMNMREVAVNLHSVRRSYVAATK